MADIEDIGFELSTIVEQSTDGFESCPSPPPPFHRNINEQEIIVQPPITFIDQEQINPIKNIVPFDSIFFSDAKNYLFETTTDESSILTETTKKSNNNFFQRFINFFRSNHNLEFHRQCQQLLNLTKYPCDMSDTIHLRILYTIYRRLTSSNEIFYTTYGSHWENIGFQSTNPETDFRSTGLFSIFFLLYFVDSMYLPLAKQIYQFSLDPLQQFPFCCIGINLANILIKYLRQTLTSQKSMQKLLNENTIIDLIGKLFIALYLNFYLIWRNNSYTIEHTQQVLSELEKILFNRPKTLVEEFDDYFRKRQEYRAQQYEFKQTNDNLI
ncbi:unnamed protein product [Adineta steineri]|uniref:ELMO domain-containing protein n=2 Tax=Adineta steineri TaxID=433720 RepID=A0A813V6H7_9BILA|nr:unnamed protein product [Adineta steineri]CAF1109578.1 unnamed protein product [Adineta steineri]CAF1451000.1 unnamed protein product [Adineta steineri]